VNCRRSFFGAVVGAVAGVLGLAGHAGAADYGYHASHNCPRCGRQVLTVYRFGPRPGYHQHRCGSTVWHHRTQ
jgi:hypothetical protein